MEYKSAFNPFGYYRYENITLIF